LAGYQDTQQTAPARTVWDAFASSCAGGDPAVLSGNFTRVPNAVLEALYCSRLTSTELRVTLAIVRRTCGWGQLSDVISYSQVADDTLIARRHVADAMRALKRAGILVSGRQAGKSSWLVWGINCDPKTWNVDALAEIRRTQRRAKKGANAGCGSDEFVPGRNDTPALKSCYPSSTQVVLGSEHTSSATQKKGKKYLKKNHAASAAVSFSRPGGRRRGSVGEKESTVPAGNPRTGSGSCPLTPEQLSRAAHMTAQLKGAGLNPDVWLAHAARDGIPIGLVLEVLEEAVRQKTAIRAFWPWAEGVFQKVCERERLDLIDREHEERKREGAENAGAILERVALRAQREKVVDG